MSKTKPLVYIKRETVTVVKHPGSGDGETYILHRWAARMPDTSLVGYSSTWFGAWRMACQSVGWKVPT